LCFSKAWLDQAFEAGLDAALHVREGGDLFLMSLSRKLHLCARTREVEFEPAVAAAPDLSLCTCSPESNLGPGDEARGDDEKSEKKEDRVHAFSLLSLRRAPDAGSGDPR
jgi:hypothetical protein